MTHSTYRKTVQATIGKYNVEKIGVQIGFPNIQLMEGLPENSTQENSTQENSTQKTQHKKTQHTKTQHRKLNTF